MIKKTLKLTLKFLILVFFLLLLCGYFLLYTQTGSHWLIHYLSDSQSIEIDQIEGTIANQLKLRGLHFTNQQIQVHSESIQYTIEDIQWFARKVNLAKLEVSTIKIIQNETTNQSKTAFEGLTLPLTINVEQLKIDQVSLITASRTESFKQIQAKVIAQPKDVHILNLNINHQNFKLEGQGELHLSRLLPFKFEPQWSVFDETTKISGQGLIQGTIEKIDSEQSVFIEQGIVTGNLQIHSKIDLTNKQVLINTELKSESLLITAIEAPIKSLQMQLTGSPKSYQLNADFNTESPQQESLSVQLKARGDLNSIDFESIQLKQKDTVITLPTQISWKDKLEINSQLQLHDFNPALFFVNWPGKLNGIVDIKSEIDDSKPFSLQVKKALIKGQLKQHNFEFNSEAIISKEAIQFMPSQLQLGQNTINFKGQIDQRFIDLQLEANWLELSLIDSELSGQISTEFSLYGEINNPQINGRAQAKNIKYKDYYSDSIEFESKGQLDENLIVKANAHQVNINQNPFDSIAIELSGHPSSHQISVHLDEASVSSTLLVQGSWKASKQKWQGQINQSDFLLKQLNSQWNLIKPVQMSYQKALKIESACWENKQTEGDFCLDSVLNLSEKDYLVNLKLNKLEVYALNPFLAKDLVIDGQLVGEANLQINQQIHIDSKLELLNGSVNFKQGSDKPYQTKINKAQLNAKHSQLDSNIAVKLELDDGSDLQLQLNLFKNLDQQLAIKGKLTGYFTNTAYLASFSDEVDEINGEFNIEGYISGLLSKPFLHIQAQQDKGHLILTQTKTKIENLIIQIDKQHDKPYQLDLRGSSGSGSVAILAELQILDHNQWKLIAKARGDNFELLKLPEIELAISPDFDIKADSNSLYIDGSFKIPTAQLNIEQLPENSIRSSPDVIIHLSADQEQPNLNYPVIFDLKAEIDQPIKVKALGLNTDITGSIRVNNIDQSQLKGFGSLKLENGQYAIYGQTLELSQGDLQFNGPLDNPMINVTASRKSLDGEVVAGVELGVTINQLQSTLYSQPRLTDLETLSYIMTGKGLNQESDFNSEQLIQAAILLGLQKSSPIFSEIQSKLGIDVFSIKEGSSSEDSLLEAGKNINKNLYVGYNQGLFNRVGFWVLRYKINQALRLETTQGENQSVDLIYLRKKK